MILNKTSSFKLLGAILSLALAISFLLPGCAGGSQSSNEAKNLSSGFENEIGSDFKEVKFHDISFAVPKEAETSDEADDESMLLTLSTSKSFGALTIYLQYDPDSKVTAQDVYKSFSEYEDCELVSPNGIEICIQDDGPYSGRTTYNYTFSYNGALYGVIIDYDPSSHLDHEDYVEGFYKTIKGSGSESSAKPSGSTKPSSAVPEGAIEWSKASKYIGKTATFYGKVVDSEYASGSNGKPTFLDVGAAYPDNNRLSVVIWGKNRSAFSSSPESMYEGKTIAVTGEVYRYDGSCNIEVTSPSQIKILD